VRQNAVPTLALAGFKGVLNAMKYQKFMLGSSDCLKNHVRVCCRLSNFSSRQSTEATPEEFFAYCVFQRRISQF
jgi:hypothetical protein